MAAIDFIRDRRVPRTRLLEASWSYRSGNLEVSGSSLGALDWSRSRYLEQEFWAFPVSGSGYLVLGRHRDEDNPPDTRVIQWGPVISEEEEEDGEEAHPSGGTGEDVEGAEDG